MAQEYQVIQDLGGLRTDAPADKISDRNASNVENIDFSLQGLIQTRGGYRQFANKIETAGQCLNAFLFRKNFGDPRDIHLRVRSTDTESIIEYLDEEDDDTPDGKFKTLIDGLEPMAKMGFAIANGDGGRKVNRLIMGNAVDDMMLWNGALGYIDSTTSDTITLTVDPLTQGFLSAGKLMINGTEYTYTGITGNAFTGVTADPSGEADGESVAQSVDTDLLKEHIITATTIALVTGSPSTITDSANGFVDAGFTAGQKIVIGGSLADDGIYTIESVTAGIITLVDGDFLTGEVAGSQITIAAGSPKGNILLTSQRKLWIAGVEGNESKVYYSQSGNVTCFGITSGLGSGGSFDLIEGSGDITMLDSRGKNTVIIHKQDAIIAYTREAIDAENVKESFDNIAEGNDVGSASPRAKAGYNQSSYYMTGAEGIKNLERAIKEDLLQISSITDIIFPSIKDFDNSNASMVYYAEKKALYIATDNADGDRVVISIYLKGSTTAGLIYDISIDNIPAEDWIIVGRDLFFVSSLDQNTYQMFGRDSDDLVQANHSYTTKEYTFQKPSNGKTFNKLFVEGLIKEGTNLRITVYYGIGSNKGSKSFTVKWDDSGVVSSETISAIGANTLGKYSLGNSDVDISASRIFSVPIHFNVNKATRYKIRLETQYDEDSEAYWAVSNIATNPTLEDIMYNEVSNSNEPAGFGIGDDVVGDSFEISPH